MKEYADWNDCYRDGNLPWDTAGPSSDRNKWTESLQFFCRSQSHLRLVAIAVRAAADALENIIGTDYSDTIYTFAAVVDGGSL
jgi:hypothetical protein